MFLNHAAIDEAVEIAERRHPDLAPYVRFLQHWRDIADQHSDGWCHWRAATGAAGRLQELVYAMRWHRQRPTEYTLPTVAEMKRALAPIRRAARKHKVPEPLLVERVSVSPRQVVRDAATVCAAEGATGLAQAAAEMACYLGEDEQIDMREAGEALMRRQAVEVPSAGAGYYAAFFRSAGFQSVEVLNSACSAGDWLFALQRNGAWYFGGQENRYPNHGFRYTVDPRRKALSLRTLITQFAQ